MRWALFRNGEIESAYDYTIGSQNTATVEADLMDHNIAKSIKKGDTVKL